MAERDVPEGMVAVPLSEAEVRVRAFDLARVVHDIDAAEEAHKIVSKAHREAVKALEERRAKLAEEVRTETELREAQGRFWDGEEGNGKRKGPRA